eukprot:1874482-Prymnesium_polylepis.1
MKEIKPKREPSTPNTIPTIARMLLSLLPTTVCELVDNPVAIVPTGGDGGDTIGGGSEVITGDETDGEGGGCENGRLAAVDQDAAAAVTEVTERPPSAARAFARVDVA